MYVYMHVCIHVSMYVLTTDHSQGTVLPIQLGLTSCCGCSKGEHSYKLRLHLRDPRLQLQFVVFVLRIKSECARTRRDALHAHTEKGLATRVYAYMNSCVRNS